MSEGDRSSEFVMFCKYGFNDKMVIGCGGEVYRRDPISFDFCSPPVSRLHVFGVICCVYSSYSTYPPVPFMAVLEIDVAFF